MNHKINADCIYLPAQKPPKSCQDYAMSSIEDSMPFLVICDGCGSSKDSDIGARLLAHGSKEFFRQIQTEESVQYGSFGLATIVNAKSSITLLGLNNQCLDSTLIFSFLYEGTYSRTFMYGDGCLFVGNQDGLKSFIKVSYKGNAPHYLSYKLDSKRYEAYQKNLTFPVELEILNYGSYHQDKTLEYALSFELDFSHFLKPGDVFIISSDGIESFVDITTGQKIEFQEVMSEICKFKNKNGEFVKRRVRRMLEDFSKKGIYNYDDISIAAFSIEDDK
jgi:serine/threonine protein phosphatase PrpC